MAARAAAPGADGCSGRRGALIGGTIRRVPFFICPNCKRRVIDDDRREGLTHQPVGCSSCGFGFLFELLEDYYPGPNTGFVVCDREPARHRGRARRARADAATASRTLLGHEVMEALRPARRGRRRPGRAGRRVGRPAARPALDDAHALGHARGPSIGDFFPAYDEDGGLLVALSPSAA